MLLINTVETILKLHCVLLYILPVITVSKSYALKNVIVYWIVEGALLTPDIWLSTWITYQTILKSLLSIVQIHLVFQTGF